MSKNDVANTMKIVQLEDQLRSQHNHISALHNFLEALSITLIDDDDHDEAVDMLKGYREQQNQND